MKKEKDILIRIDFDLKEQIKRKARIEGLSLSSFIRVLIIKSLKNE